MQLELHRLAGHQQHQRIAIVRVLDTILAVRALVEAIAVIAWATAQRVVAGAASQEVVSFAGIENIIPFASVQRIISTAGGELVVPGTAGHCLAGGGAVERLSRACRPDHGREARKSDQAVQRAGIQSLCRVQETHQRTDAQQGPECIP